MVTNLPDLNTIYKVIQYHGKEERDSGGVFIVLPTKMAEQFPEEGRAGEDDSPAHITVAYLETMNEMFEERAKEVVVEVCREFKPFKVKLGKPKKFTNQHDQTIIHSPVVSSKLKKFHEELKRKLMAAHLPVSNKFPDFKPHITIEYVDPGEQAQFGDVVPQGDWMVDSVWLWGGAEPHLVLLGK